jgi:hypothetical protein
MAEVCFSILFFHETVAFTNRFLNGSYSSNFIPINSSNPKQTLSIQASNNFGINSAYGPSFAQKCVVGFQNYQLSAAARQTLSFNMTGNGVYSTISSSKYFVSYAYFCLSKITCENTNMQYYPFIN